MELYYSMYLQYMEKRKYNMCNYIFISVQSPEKKNVFVTGPLPPYLYSSLEWTN